MVKNVTEKVVPNSLLDSVYFVVKISAFTSRCLVSVSEEEKIHNVLKNFSKMFQEPDILKQETGKVILGFQELSETKSKAGRQKQQKKSK